MLDLGRIMFFRLAGRHDRTKVQLAEKFADMIEMVTNLKSAQNQIGDDFCRPSISIVSARAGTFSEQYSEFSLLDRCEAATSSATGFSYQSVQSVLIDFLSPSFEGGEGNVQSVDDVIVRRSVENHVSCQQSFLAAIGNPFRCSTHVLLYERNAQMVQFLRGRQ